jgi:hypothetical protein
VSADVAYEGSRFARVHPGLLVCQFSRHSPLRLFLHGACWRSRRKNDFHL